MLSLHVSLQALVACEASLAIASLADEAAQAHVSPLVGLHVALCEEGNSAIFAEERPLSTVRNEVGF